MERRLSTKNTLHLLDTVPSDTLLSLTFFFLILIVLGKRRCLGESLAKANVFLILSALVHNFNIELAPNEPKPSLEPYDGVVLSPKPFKCMLVPR